MPGAPPPAFSSPGKKKGVPGGKEGDPPAPWAPRPSGAAGPPGHASLSQDNPGAGRSPPRPPERLHTPARRPPSRVALRRPGPPGPRPRSAATPAPAPGPRPRALPHRTWAGSGTRNWPGCPPPPRPRAAGWSGRPWPRRPRRPRRLSAAARPAPGAGVACPGRPARPGPCGAGGGEPGARRAPSSAPHAAAPLRGGLRGAGGAAAAGRVMSAAAPRRDRGGHGQWRGGAGAAARRQPMGGGMRRSGRRGGARRGAQGSHRGCSPPRLRLPRGARPARCAPHCPPNARQPSAASAKPVVAVWSGPRRGALAEGHRVPSHPPPGASTPKCSATPTSRGGGRGDHCW